jgi:hypothetical protein
MICDKLQFNQTHKDLYFAGSISMSYALKKYPEMCELYQTLFDSVEMHIDSIKTECFIKMFSNMKKLIEKNMFDHSAKYFSLNLLKLVQLCSVEFSKPELMGADFNSFKTMMEAINVELDDDMNFNFEVK